MFRQVVQAVCRFLSRCWRYLHPPPASPAPQDPQEARLQRRLAKARQRANARQIVGKKRRRTITR